MSDRNEKNQDEILNQLHVDALQELGNIGAAHSATALSQLLNRRVDMSVPRVNLVPIEQLYTRISDTPDEPVAAILSETKGGEGKVDILITFDFNSTRRIIEVFRENPPTSIGELSDFDKELLKEVGNILILHAISAMNTFIGMTLYPTVPQLVVDMNNAILEALITKEGKNRKYMISVECDIFTGSAESGEYPIKGIVFLFPDESELNKLMTHLYGEGWDQF